MKKNKLKTVIIGIDGVPLELINRLSKKGIMPNFAELRDDAIFRKMESSIPEISSVSWSSIITGKNPGEHGIFGFTELIPGTYTISFPNFSSLRTRPFWQKNDKKYVIINVPSTYPAGELNGFLVSGFVSPDLERATYPKSYVSRLREMGYEIDVDASKGHKSKSLLLEEIFRVHKIRMNLCRELWKKINWDVFVIVFTGSDRLEHFLWDAYEYPNHEHHQGFLDYFTEVDRSIGEIVSNMRPEDNLIICSDHGMELVKTNVNVNKVLRDNGCLVLDKKPSRNYNNIVKGTTAFAMDPGRIYLHRAEKYPRGSVRRGDEEDIIQKLIELFTKLEFNGKRVMKAVYRKEEIYKGPYLERAPDIVLLANRGFNLKASISGEEAGKALTGKHSQDNAILLVKKKSNKEIVPANPKVEDITKILSYWSIKNRL